MRQDNERCYGIAELAELGGVTRRTVRYYVQRGLLPTPLGTGRGPHYTREHLERLIRIRQLQESGVPLAEIAARLDSTPQTPASTPAALPAPSTSLRASSTHVLPEGKGEAWMRYVLADRVELHVRADVMRLQPWQLAQLVETIRHTLGPIPPLTPSGRRKIHERTITQLSDDVASHLDTTPECAH